MGSQQDESHLTLMNNNKVTDEAWETNKGQGLTNHSYEQQGHGSGMGNQQGSRDSRLALVTHIEVMIQHKQPK